MATELPPEEKKFWFPAKRYGWGWGAPCCWQGWLVFLGWIAVFILGIEFFKNNVVATILFSFILSALLIAICWIKGEKPRWRWGGD